MTLTFKTGNMFDERGEAIVNTVNCVGVMGKGVALEFKRRWPENFKVYKRLCDDHTLRPGKVYIHQNADLLSADGRKFLINFPTKDHWRGKSKLEFIEAGLDDFVQQIRRLRIRSVVMPPLGCGNGGLAWSDVQPLIEKKLSTVADVEFVVFAPSADESEVDVPEDGKEAPEMEPGGIKMTFERALLLKAFDELAIFFDGSLTRITMQKIVYFLQELGVDFKVPFVPNSYGPYSDDLRAAFVSMEKQGLIAGFTSNERDTTVTSTGVSVAEGFLASAGKGRASDLVGRVSRLVQGYESPFGMELLSSVHYVANKEKTREVSAIVNALGKWSSRKGTEFDPSSVAVAVDRLVEDRLLN